MKYTELVNVIALGALREFWQRHPEAETALREWYRSLRRAEFASFAELGGAFSSADLARTSRGTVVTIFDVGGTKYRVVVKIDCPANLGLVRFVFTHAECTRWNQKGRPE